MILHTVSDQDKICRIHRSIEKLKIELEQFPIPSQVQIENKIHSTKGNDQILDDLDSQEVRDDKHLDVASSMQLVRSRFKLLMVQLNFPYLSLKQLIDDRSSSSDGPFASNALHQYKSTEGATSEW